MKVAFHIIRDLYQENKLVLQKQATVLVVPRRMVHSKYIISIFEAPRQKLFHCINALKFFRTKSEG